ncbi:putative porin [Niabella ginsengisoli]|uniref:putative porin n=1 Tax=Niabella ginsengisoli TaxID=522298 RepID=UPI0021D40F37|nr:putative porin [Niabella ginsengisoli]
MRGIFLFILIAIGFGVFAQNPVRSVGDRFRGINNAGSGSDTLGKRNKFEDSITISYRYLDTTRTYRLDSSINDFTVKYPIPADYYFLGNTGSAAQSFLFAPNMKAGWDAGFHAYDIYKFTGDKARFFTATRPYSEISYMLGKRSEQFIELMHTQNIRPNWNASAQYRLISAPGIYRSQKTSHNNYLITNWVQSKDKRYANFFMIVANKIKGGESGGIDTAAKYIDDPDYAERSRMPVRLGDNTGFNTGLFNTDVPTGNKYDDFNAVMRQQFDFGRKDSIVNDSSVVPLFFPRVRLEHTVRYSAYKYLFSDENPTTERATKFYSAAYGLENLQTPFKREDYWRELMNDFSIYTFPDEKNTQQFLKVGVAMQNLKGIFRDGITETSDSINYSDDRVTTGYNILGHGEYRNRTKNQRWDLMARGNLYFVGMNAGDYEAGASIQSSFGEKIGSLRLGFENVNRTPSYITNSNSSFYLMPGTVDLNKENSTHLYADLFQPLLKLQLSGHYYLVNNYVYYTDYYKINQAPLFNLLQIAAHKVFAAGKKISSNGLLMFIFSR